MQKIDEEPKPNYGEVNWDEFRETLGASPLKLPNLEQISCQRQLDQECNSLTKALQEMIYNKVPNTRPITGSK
jgi:hypothetical protein